MTVYVLLRDASGDVIARRYLERDRLVAWLKNNAPGGARCEVYGDAPERGGDRLELLARGQTQTWAPEAPVAGVGAIERFMADEHVRIDGSLAASERPDGSIDEVAYARFRHDLLRHIGMEEKVLLPFARERRGGEPLPVAGALRRDHGEIAKLLVGSPTMARLDALRALLARHNSLEEGPEGLYAACDELAREGADDVVERLRAQPSVPLAPYYDGPAHRRAQ